MANGTQQMEKEQTPHPKEKLLQKERQNGNYINLKINYKTLRILKLNLTTNIEANILNKKDMLTLIGIVIILY